MIVSMYAEDVAHLQLLIAQIPDYAIYRDLVSVRTTEEAMGGEANIVITTLPRSAKVGFTTEESLCRTQEGRQEGEEERRDTRQAD